MIDEIVILSEKGKIAGMVYITLVVYMYFSDAIKKQAVWNVDSSCLSS